MNTVILEKILNSGEDRFDVFSRLVQNRIIFINDLISDKNTSDIIATLLYLDLDENNNDKITVFINAECGDIRNVLAIYDIMQILSVPIETFCIGTAMREAVLLLAAGTKGSRLISKNADICLSQVLSQSVSQSDLTNTKISHDKILKDNEIFLKLLSKHLGKSLKTLKKDIERQKFMSASQAVAYGIADEVV